MAILTKPTSSINLISKEKSKDFIKLLSSNPMDKDFKRKCMELSSGIKKSDPEK